MSVDERRGKVNSYDEMGIGANRTENESTKHKDEY